MTFCATESVLETLNQAFKKGEEWCEDQLNAITSPRSSSTKPDFSLALRQLETEMNARRLGMSDAMLESELRVRSTMLQSARPELIEQAMSEFCASQPDSVEELREGVTKLYEVMYAVLLNCEQSASSTPSEGMFRRVREELQEGISFLIWKSRPADDRVT